MSLIIMKPLLKWVGGKKKLLNILFRYFPREIDTYYEPFLGGGSVLIELLSSDVKVKRIRVNDLNVDLINMYRLVKDNPENLMCEIDKLIELYNSVDDIKHEKRKKFVNQSKDEAVMNGKVGVYYYYRDIYNSTTDTTLKSALLIFLNKTCFRGLYRVGKNGFNVPYGNYKNPSFYDRANVLSLSVAFRDVEFSSEDFEIFLNNVKDTDFVYLDPPYVNTFSGYNVDNFDRHDVLLGVCKGMKRWIQSNSECEYNENNYSEYDIYKIDTNYGINSVNPGKSVREILIVAL